MIYGRPERYVEFKRRIDAIRAELKGNDMTPAEQQKYDADTKAQAKADVASRDAGLADPKARIAMNPAYQNDPQNPQKPWFNEELNHHRTSLEQLKDKLIRIGSLPDEYHTELRIATAIKIRDLEALIAKGPERWGRYGRAEGTVVESNWDTSIDSPANVADRESRANWRGAHEFDQTTGNRLTDNPDLARGGVGPSPGQSGYLANPDSVPGKIGPAPGTPGNQAGDSRSGIKPGDEKFVHPYAGTAPTVNTASWGSPEAEAEARAATGQLAGPSSNYIRSDHPGVRPAQPTNVYGSAQALTAQAGGDAHTWQVPVITAAYGTPEYEVQRQALADWEAAGHRSQAPRPEDVKTDVPVGNLSPDASQVQASPFAPKK